MIFFVGGALHKINTPYRTRIAGGSERGDFTPFSRSLLQMQGLTKIYDQHYMFKY